MFNEIKFGFLEEKITYCVKHNLEYTSRLYNTKDNNAWWSICPACVKEKDEENLRMSLIKMEEDNKLKLVNRYFDDANIPPLFNNKDLNNYECYVDEQKQVIKNLKDFIVDFSTENITNLIFCGAPGTGKTHLSISIAKEIMLKGFKSLFIPFYILMREIHKGKWNGLESLNKLTLPDLLIIDEITDNLSNDEGDNLFQVINQRYFNLKSTIIISNLDQLSFKNCVGERIFRRLINGNSKMITFYWNKFE